MTVATTVRKAGPYAGDGATVLFAFAFKVFTTADVVVTKTSTAGVDSTLVLGSDYTVALNADQDNNPGGTVTTVVAPLGGGTPEKITITSAVANTQVTSLPQGGAYNAKVIERALDKITILVQQALLYVLGALRQPVTDSTTIGTLPNKETRANTLLGFDSSGDPIPAAGVTGLPATAFGAAWIALANAGAALTALGFSAFGQTLIAAADAAAARTTLAAAKSGANTDISSLSSPAIGAATATTQAGTDGSTKVATTAMVQAALSSAVGLARNAKMSVTAASASGTFTADEIVVETALGGNFQRLANYSQAINLATTGAGGMDTGSAPASGFVSLYAIAKADGTKNILACNVTTSSGSIYGGANMPSGYTYSALIGIWPTNGSGQFLPGLIADRYFYNQAPVQIASGLSGSSSLTSRSVSSGVPSAARFVDCALCTQAAGSGAVPAVAADATGTGIRAATGVTRGSTVTTPFGTFSGHWVFQQCPVVTAQTLYWSDGSGLTWTFFTTGYGW